MLLLSGITVAWALVFLGALEASIWVTATVTTSGTVVQNHELHARGENLVLGFAADAGLHAASSSCIGLSACHAGGSWSRPTTIGRSVISSAREPFATSCMTDSRMPATT